MPTKKKPVLLKNQQEYGRALRHIRRLGYTAPEAPARITQKSLRIIHEAEQSAIQASKAYTSAKRRQSYCAKHGIETPGLKIERGKSADEYAKYTYSYFRAYAEEQAKQRYPERVQPYENRYQSSIETILKIDNALQEFTGFAPRGPRDAVWADRKNRMYLVVKSYWTDAVDMSDMQDVTRFASALEGRAETLFDLVDNKMRMSNTIEEDRAYLSTAIEIISGAKLTRTDSDIINEAIDDYIFY